MDGYGSKIRKVNRCRPVVSIETILATRQEFFFTKVAPVQSITDIVLFLISAALLNIYFFLHYHLVFRKEIYFFKCLYFSEYDIRMSWCVFWSRKGPSTKYVCNWWVDGRGSFKMRTAVYIGKKCHTSCVRTHLHYLFSCFFSCRNLTLSLLKKDEFVRNG